MDNLLNHRGAITEIPSIVRALRAKRVLLITGKSSFDFSPAKEIIEKGLKAIQVEVIRYSDFSVNPKVEDIEKAIKEFKNRNPDLIIGIGGGSVMDTAKLFSIFQNENRNIRQVIKDKMPLSKRSVSLVLIPTTAGSGSEATHFAVVYIGGEKFSVATPCLLPDFTILDASLTDSMPPYLTACSAFDAFSQAVESYWAKGATLESRKYAEQSLKIFNKIYTQLFSNPDSKTRDAMLEASFLAGKAINISKTTASHALSYTLTTHFGLPHGHAVIMTLASCAQYNFNSSINYPGWEEKDKINLLNLLNCYNIEDFKNKITEMMSIAGLAQTLQIPSGKTIQQIIPTLVESVNIERLKNNPMPLSHVDIFEIYKACFA